MFFFITVINDKNTYCEWNKKKKKLKKYAENSSYSKKGKAKSKNKLGK